VARVAHPCDCVESHDQLVCGEMANHVIKLVVISHRETVMSETSSVEKLVEAIGLSGFELR
jgi:hypothetical protein